MKKSKFTEEQIAFALRQAESGTRVVEVCRKMEISEQTFFCWKKKYGGLGVSELRRVPPFGFTLRVQQDNQEEMLCLPLRTFCPMRQDRSLSY